VIPSARSTSSESQVVSRASFGDRYRAFVDRHEIAWELAFAALAILFVALAFVPVDPESQGEQGVEAVEWLITGLFALEFGSRLIVARDRRSYVRGHWIDMISLIPPARWLRPFRLLRLLRLIRAFAGAGRALVRVDRMARHGGLIWLLVAWFAVMLLSSIALYVAEKGVNAAVDSPIDALWWGITTMTTVGYGDVYPLTPEGRIAAVVLMVLGIGLYSAITATVTSFLIVGQARDAGVTDQLERVAMLRANDRLTEDEFAAAKSKILG
jgi:voltage-gated potassium channel